MAKTISKSTFTKALTVGLIAITALAGCKGGGLFNGKLFKERASEKPAPSDEGVEKSFFVDAKGKPKTFLCAWAPEIGRGAGGEQITLVANMAMHCNIEFEITESYLIGKTINPSFPNDRSRWKEALKIPIKSHYYYERQKDGHGRETNEWIENTSRSHWSARPMMKLDLAGMHVWNFGDWTMDYGTSVSSVEDIEWDREHNFLGFSMNMTASGIWMGGQKGEIQGRYRVNFLKFDHDETFQKVPYHTENARFMNILHVMGRKVEGVEQELYAAHWDLRNPTTLYISGVPADQQQTILTAVEKWNLTLAEIGVIGKGQKAFIPVIKDLKHPFDLRYPAVHWISDKRISMNSPLGIGMAHADVRNGKIIWGGVTLYGGMLETYINRYAPVEAASSINMVEGLSPFSAFSNMFSSNPIAMNGVEQVKAADRGQLIANMTRDQRAFLENELVTASKGNGDPAKAQALKEQLAQLTGNSPGMNRIVADLIQQAGRENENVASFFKRKNLQQMMGAGNAPESLTAAQVAERRNDPRLAAALKDQNPGNRQARLATLNRQNSPFFIETDRTVEKMAGAWMASEAQTTRNYPDMLESVVADLALHELGHFLGLGHQFKENIVPAEGTVPSHFIKELKEKATEEKGFTNYTSVMGYRNGRVEMLLPANDLNPGPHDKLVLRYLYKGQYSVFDKDADAFVYAKVPASGKIPMFSNVQSKSGQFKSMPTAYFPACNDYEASLDADPFCNRWDRGSKAEDIVASYFQQISDNLLARLYSLVGGGNSHWVHEYYLWASSFDSFSRVRLFYDEMRRRMRSEPRLKPLWNELRNNQDALLEFSQACQKDDLSTVKSPTLQRLFAFEDIKDLCRANALALREFKFFLNLPEGDYTRIDHTNRYISGGYLEGDVSRSYGGFLGSWFQLSNFPLKFVSMFTITAANPFQLWGYWLQPNMFYDHEENRALYRTLYPREYTRLISDAVQNNMRFAATGLDNTTSIGRTILATSSLLPYQRYQANDAARLPREYSVMLDQQTEFQLSMVAVILTAVKPDANSNVKADHYKKFTANVYDFFTGKSTTASEVFVLPKGDVIVRANGMFIYPVTKLKFYEGTSAYAIAYKVGFDYEEGDPLVEDSVKSALLEKHNSIGTVCVDGFNRKGLGNYFDSAQRDFDGFYIPPGIAQEIGKEKTGLFYESIDKAFAKYDAYSRDSIPENFPLKSMRSVCDEAMRGIGQLSASAALLNGYWLSITPDYVEK